MTIHQTVKEGDLIPFTANPPACSKCGGDLVRRVFIQGAEPVDYGWPYLSDTEFLKCVCQSCHHEWGQKTKSAGS